MTPRSKLAVILLSTAGAVGLSFLHPFGNPRAVPSQPREALLRDAHMPGAAKQVLILKCADCHSETTQWPVYTFLAPGSWLMERDVAKARGHLNLSHWLELSQDQRDVLLNEIVQQAKKGTMPLPRYRVLHWGSKLTPADVAALSLLIPGDPPSGAILGGDSSRGKITFEKRCTGCHAVDANREGPALRGIFNRRAGAREDFRYSDALKKSGLTWSDGNLERWLQDSDSLIPGNAMDFSVAKAQERADIIAYLATLKGPASGR